MASTIKTKGIILKMTDTPGKDKLLFILTHKGLLKAFMKPKRNAGKKSYTIDLFTYGEIVYFITDSGNCLINSITPENYFYKIREDIARFYAAGYFSSLALYLCEDITNDMSFVFELVYNSFSRLANGQNVKKIKAVFELSVIRLLGLSPCLEADVKSQSYHFEISDGRLYANKQTNGILVSRELVLSVYKILTGDNASLVFDVACDDVDALDKFSEQYLIYHTERTFDALKYLNGVI